MANHPKSAVQYTVEDRGYETPCWVWRRSTNGAGYGQLKIGGQLTLAHRHFFELANGPIPADEQLDHLCRVTLCVRPSHLEVVTNAENGRRGNAAKLSHADVLTIRADLEGGATPAQLADRYSVTAETIRAIRRGSRWSGVGG